MFIYDGIIPSGNLLQEYHMYRLEVVLKSLENKESLIKLPCTISGNAQLISSSVFTTTFEDFETFGKILSEIQKNLIPLDKLIDDTTADGILYRFISQSIRKIERIVKSNSCAECFLFKSYQKLINGTVNSKFNSTEKSSIILEKLSQGTTIANVSSLVNTGALTITYVSPTYRCKNGKYSQFIEK